MTAVEEDDPEVVRCPKRKFTFAEQLEIKKQYEKLIHKIANRQARSLKSAGVTTIDADDLFVIGLRATFNAIETHDASRGAKESSWVAMLARRAIQREVYKALGLKTKDINTLRQKNPSEADAARLAAVRNVQVLPLPGDVYRPSDVIPPIAYEPEPGWIGMYEDELRWLHREIRKRLTPMERRVLDTVFDEEGSETRLAEKHRVTKQRINQIKLNAIAKLKKAANRTLLRF